MGEIFAWHSPWTAHCLEPWVWKEPCYPRAQGRRGVSSSADFQETLLKTLFIGGFPSIRPVSTDLVDSAIRFSAILKLPNHISGISKTKYLVIHSTHLIRRLEALGRPLRTWW